jgi:hypothetical protein
LGLKALILLLFLVEARISDVLTSKAQASGVWTDLVKMYFLTELLFLIKLGSVHIRKCSRRQEGCQNCTTTETRFAGGGLPTSWNYYPVNRAERNPPHKARHS